MIPSQRRSAPPRPRASAAFYKAHGLGNDYLVFEEGDAWAVSAEAVEAVCDRWRGPGGDGIVVLLAPGGGEPFRLRMFNPDGGEFERSGNGLRVLAAFLASEGRVGDAPFPVEVGGDRITMQVLGRPAPGLYDIGVEMGRVSFEPGAVGLDPARLEADGPGVDVQTVSVGNPHCVVFRDALSLEELRRLGPALATHPAFAAGTNVQLALPEGGGRVRALVWERGVGHTSASGTSACAVASAAVRRGHARPGEVEVVMEGGILRVTVTDDYDVTLRGPVQEVMRGELLPGFVEGLGA